jgi:2-oxoglutarate ferredoxin oxidoreductase subunit gamma
MSTRYEIRLTGSGGQGLILAGIILAEAAGLHDGKFVCQTQSYGPEARGGASKAEVVISDFEIDYPKAIQPDVFLAMNQTSLDAFISDMKPDGLLLVDADLVKEFPPSRSLPGLAAAVRARVPRGTQELNQQALAAGVAAAQSLGRTQGRNPAKGLKF